VTLSILSRKSAFVYPLGKAPRTAVLVPWFRQKDAVRVFNEGWSPEAAVFAPEAIAGTREQLLALARTAPEVTHALIAVAQPGQPWLTAADRDQLWRAFHVPVFQQLVSESGELLAAECEAHDGLHLHATELPGYAIDPTRCACGLATPRIIPKKPAQKVQAAAASRSQVL
jgi:hypothetical protein